MCLLLESMIDYTSVFERALDCDPGTNGLCWRMESRAEEASELTGFTLLASSTWLHTHPMLE